MGRNLQEENKLREYDCGSMLYCHHFRSSLESILLGIVSLAES